MSVNYPEIKEKVYSGERLTFDDGVTLYNSDDLIAVGRMANMVRESIYILYITTDTGGAFAPLDKGKGDWLNVAGTAPFKAAVDGKDSTEAGQEIDLTVKYIYSPAFKIVGGYSIFIPGSAAKERSSGKGDNSDWGYRLPNSTFSTTVYLWCTYNIITAGQSG